MYKKITDAEYFAIEALSASGLKELGISPAHFRFKEERKSEAMGLGTLVHKMVEDIENVTANIMFGDRRTKEGKAAYDECVKAGKIWTTEDSFEKAVAIANAVLSDKTAAMLLSGVKEEAGLITDPVFGVPLKIKPDSRRDDLKLIADLKTHERGMRDRDLSRQAANLGYDIQADFYVYVNKLITGEDYKFCHVYVENAPPYAVRCRALSAAALDAGARKWMPLLQVYKACLETGVWNSFEGGIKELDLPSWAMGDEL